RRTATEEWNSRLSNQDKQENLALARGITYLADTLRVTFGPKGRKVDFTRKDGTTIVNRNNYTAANEIQLQDPVENMGLRLARDAGTQTRKIAGAGMTTTILLAQAIVSETVKAIGAGANPKKVRHGIETAVRAICGYDRTDKADNKKRMSGEIHRIS